MKVVTDSETIDLGVTEIRPTIEITDFSRRVTDDFGVTTVVPRAFSRRMSVRFALPTADVDRVQRRLAELRATAARWTADPRFAWLDFRGFYKDLSLDLAVPPLSYCTLTVEGLAETETVEDAGGDPAPDGCASTLLLLQPVDVTDAVLLSSNVPEYDHPEWSPGISYAKGAKVIRGAVHRIYESAADDNEGNDPAGASGLWIDIGPTNRWAMFDQALGTATSLNDGVTVTLSSGAIRAIALLDVVGATVRVQGPGYDRTQAVGTGAVLFGDLPGGPGDVIVTIAGAGSVAVGTLLAGKLAPLGITGADPSAGITDYSRKERDDFGEWTVVPRSWSKTMATKAVIRTDAVDLVANRIAAVRARPSLWIAAENLDCLTVYGFFKTVSIEVGANVSVLSLSVEGLSEAAPLSPGLPAPNWPDIVDSDPERPKPEDGATVGGTIGDDIKDGTGNVVSPEDLLTSLGISADTVKVAGVDGNDLLNAISTAQDEIDGLIETYGETAAASAAAQEARDARDVALGAATVAGGHASTASTKRDEASGFMLAAQGSAVTAGDAAGVATAKAAAAGESESSAAASASVSANYAEGARRGAVATMPSTFEQDGAFWSYLTGSETTAVRPEDAGYPITYPTTQDGKVLRVNNSTGYTHVSQRRRINLASVKGRRFRIRVAARLVTPPATGTVELRVGLYALTENFSQIVYGGYYENITGNQYAPMTGAGLYEATIEFTISNSIVPDGNGYTPVWSTFGGYLFNPAAPNLTGIVDFISIKVEDITESQAAKAEAGIAADQAAITTADAAVATDSKNITATYRDQALGYRDQAEGHKATAQAQANIAIDRAGVANAAAAAAQQSAILSASIGNGYLNKDPGFDDYPSPAVGQLPTAWGADEKVGTSTYYRVADNLGGYALRTPVAASTISYLAQAAYLGAPTISPGGYYVVEADIVLNSGTLSGVGIIFRTITNTAATVGNTDIIFSNEPDATGTVAGAGSAGKAYQFRKLVQAPSLSTVHGFKLFVMPSYSPFGDDTAARDITWLKVGLRPASLAEIRDQTVLAPLQATVLDQASVLATHDMMLASRLIRTSAGAGYAELAMSALDSNGQAASRIGMTADWISFGSANQRTMEVVDGLVRVNGDLYVNTGRIVADTGTHMKVIGKGFGTTGQFIEWFGPKMPFDQCSEANAVTFIKTNGAAYFGGSLAAGALKNAVQTTSLSSTASVTTGPFGSNGGPRVVTLSYAYSDYRAITGLCPARPPMTASIQLYRGTDATGTLLTTLNITDGEWTCQPGFGEFEAGQWTARVSGSLTYTDNSGGTSASYFARITAVNMPSGSDPRQSVSIVSIEE